MFFDTYTNYFTTFEHRNAIKEGSGKIADAIKDIAPDTTIPVSAKDLISTMKHFEEREAAIKGAREKLFELIKEFDERALGCGAIVIEKSRHSGSMWPHEAIKFHSGEEAYTDMVAKAKEEATKGINDIKQTITKAQGDATIFTAYRLLMSL